MQAAPGLLLVSGPMLGYKPVMRAILALLLSLILALASQSEAVARSEMAGASDQILCSTAGATTITLDATGHAVPGHPCTHCLAAAATASLNGLTRLPLAPLTRAVRLSHGATAQALTRLALTPNARAPPVLAA